jgi:hypothetical protein
MSSVAYPVRAVKGHRSRRAAQLSGPLNVAPWTATETWSPDWMDGAAEAGVAMLDGLFASP